MRRRARVHDGEDVWIGVDVGGERSATAVVWVNEGCTSAPRSITATRACSRPSTTVRALAGRFNVLVYDPWRFGQAAQELEREGLLVGAFPQHDARMLPASARLHAAIVERKLTLPPTAASAPRLRRRRTPLSARLADRKPNPRANIDAIIALAMAVERAERKPAPVELLGWL